MRCALILIAAISAAGCNQLFDLQSTDVIDAFAPPVDAPWMCPAAGEAPRFAPAENQFSPQNCASYSVSRDANLATASCIDGAVWEGPIDEPLVVTDLTSGAQLEVQVPRLAPEGDELFVRRCKPSQVGCVLSAYRRGATPASWALEADLSIPIAVDTSTSFSSPSRGPDRRLIVTDAARTAHELHEVGTAWVQLGADYDPAALGLAEIAGYPRLSADGLRMTLLGSFTTGAFQWMYGERASRGERFTQLRALPDFSFDSGELLVTDDCGHAYYQRSGALGLYFKQP